MKNCRWDCDPCTDYCEESPYLGLWGLWLPAWKRPCCHFCEPLCPPPCPPSKPACPPPKPSCSSPAKHVWQISSELTLSLPPHRRICEVEVELSHCPGAQVAQFTVTVDYEDCCGCRRCLRRSCQKCLFLPARVCQICLKGTPNFTEHCGTLTVFVELTEKDSAGA